MSTTDRLTFPQFQLLRKLGFPEWLITDYTKEYASRVISEALELRRYIIGNR
jgi:hypothetical protein